ncbi:hypothetical protein EGI22_05675 [Lacihabitans sp. LS3-19]|uniref:hypothetical protein n=1 Tax=Lacihabitans sp. LS3-19 TaxID=2487335 RepID=UPI0020CE2CD6|nr:hypothetical protein [Lacihabitans sp. LS3-19]MCP9767391.1 hypothetical protein [Lacihabitans sp. LS3-19]
MKALKLLIFFLPLISLAQEDFGKLYYPEINKAELAYTQDDYQASFTHYASAFSAVKKPLARDIFNAVVCKFMLKDFEGAKPLLLKLAQKGIPAEDLEKKEVFQIEEIKSEWANYKFVYEQFQSMAEEKEDKELIKNLSRFDSLYSEVNQNLMVFLVIDGELKRMTRRDFDANKKDEILDESEAKSKSILNAIKSSELFVEAQKYIVDYVLKNGIVSEEVLHVKGINFYRNEFSDAIQKYKFRILPTEEGGTRSEIIPFIAISEQKKVLFDQKIIEAVKNGTIHRDLAPQLFLNFRDNERVLFSKINIENTDACKNALKSKTSLIYYTPEIILIPDSMKCLVNADLFLDDDELIFEKAKYSVLKNSYFLITSNAQLEETTVPNCEMALDIMKTAKIVNLD